MNRIEALCDVVRTAEADAMLLTGEVNLIYATEATGLEGYCLLLADGTALFITDGRYIEAAEMMLPERGFQVILRTADLTFGEFMLTLLQAHNVRNLLYEDDVLTVRQYTRFRTLFEDITLHPMRDGIERLRARKSEAEIEAVVSAQRIAEKAFDELLSALHDGISEREAAAFLDYRMAVHGSEKPSFQTILLFGENTSKPHGVPSDRRLRKGDLITADFGAVFRGYHSDMTRTFAWGEVTDEVRKVYDIVLRAQAAAFEQAKAGTPCCAMHNAAQSVISAAGYGEYFTHSLGHSLGLEIHESPSAAKSCGTLLEDGMILTDEPGIYLAGQFGIRIEDMVLIHGDTPINLTHCPKSLRIL
ncbi:MAG: aminopeptidase P family protein [Oscillospiraceae bacterium]|nr:aminopeptidase P family protein [Oscillospiraceae bacterium]